MKANVQFYCAGERIAADLYRPDEHSVDRRQSPAILIGSGWMGRKGGLIDRFCQHLTNAGYVTMAVDYRGFGESEGRTGQIRVDEQVQDFRAGVAFLRSQEFVDPQRVWVFGVLNGGSAALQAATEDDQIAGVVAFYPFGDGGRWLRSLRRHREWLELLKLLDADRAERARTGVSGTIDASQVLVRAGSALADETSAGDSDGSAAPTAAPEPLTIESVDALMTFRPEDHVHRIGNRPVVVVGIADDAIIPFDEVRRVYDRLTGPKKLIVVPGGHPDIYKEPCLTNVLEEVARSIGQMTSSPAASFSIETYKVV